MASSLVRWAVILRMLSPVMARRWALWTMRPRTASAMVGSAMIYHDLRSVKEGVNTEEIAAVFD